MSFPLACRLSAEKSADRLTGVSLYVTCCFFLPALMFSLSVCVQLLSCVGLFVTPWTAARQASQSFTISWSLLKLMSIELVMPSNHFILCTLFSSCPQSFPVSGSFPTSWLFTLGGQSIGASASASVLPMNIQGWFPLGLTGSLSLFFAILIIICLGVFLFELILFGSLCASWTWMSVSCPRLGSFQVLRPLIRSLALSLSFLLQGPP